LQDIYFLKYHLSPHVSITWLLLLHFFATLGRFRPQKRAVDEATV